MHSLVKRIIEKISDTEYIVEMKDGRIAKWICVRLDKGKKEKFMTPNEIRHFQQLKKIMQLCDEADKWEGPIYYEDVCFECLDQLRQLKQSIGNRILEDEKLSL
jgi:hypothetical protein